LIVATPSSINFGRGGEKGKEKGAAASEVTLREKRRRYHRFRHPCQFFSQRRKKEKKGRKAAVALSVKKKGSSAVIIPVS